MRHVPGLGWGSAVTIDRSGDSGIIDPRLAIDGDGNAVAVWTQFDPNLGATTIHAASFE